MAQLSHEAYKVALDATFWARHDLRFAAFRPTVLDYEAVGYLHEITRHVPWIARKVEKSPASPRVSSKFSYDLVAFDTMMLRRRYQSTSFRPSTDAKVKYLLNLLDEMAPFYAKKSASGEGGMHEKKVTTDNIKGSNQGVEPTGVSRCDLAEVLGEWRLTPAAHARRWASPRVSWRSWQLSD